MVTITLGNGWETIETVKTKIALIQEAIRIAEELQAEGEVAAADVAGGPA